MKTIACLLTSLLAACIAILAFLVCYGICTATIAAIEFPPFAFLWAPVGLMAVAAVTIAFVELPGLLRECLA